MDYENYRKNFYTHPQPEPRYAYTGLHGITFFYQDYEAAVSFYSQVLGPPAYKEGTGTHGWQVGSTWLTLLRGVNGNPRNVEATFVMQSPQAAEQLQAAIIAAGGKGEEPSNQLMYQPIRYCPVRDPFGVDLLIISPLKS